MSVTSLQPSVLVVTGASARLRGPRGQSELATADMDCFAACIRGQADVLGLQIIDTTGVAPARSVAKLRAAVEMLLAEPRTLQTVVARVERRFGLPADVE